VESDSGKLAWSLCSYCTKSLSKRDKLSAVKGVESQCVLGTSSWEQSISRLVPVLKVGASGLVRITWFRALRTSTASGANRGEHVVSRVSIKNIVF
jgi:hypothetical protein